MQVPKKLLRKNAVKFAWYKVLTKRVYLPVITIYLVDVAHVSLAEIALIAAITGGVQLALQLPGGYVADKFGNEKALKTSTWFITASPLLYVLLPNFWGGLFGSLLFFGGWAFQQGAGEAFMHDTMDALGQKNHYARVMGRAQSYGLVGNLLLTAFIPATYLVDPRLPFVLGFISLVGMSAIIYSFAFPAQTQSRKLAKPGQAIAAVFKPANFTIFLLAGTATALAISGGEYKEILFKAQGINPALFGLIMSAGSLLGAMTGLFTHQLTHKLTTKLFYVLDIVLLAGAVLAIGYFNDPFISVGAAILFTGYGRIRQIVVQSKLLADTKEYKATLLSGLSFTTQVIQIGVVALFGWFVTHFGLASGHTWMGLTMAMLLLVLWLINFSPKNGSKAIRPSGSRVN